MRAAVSTLLPAVQFDAGPPSRSTALPSRPPVGCPHEPARHLRITSPSTARPGRPESLIEAEKFWLVAEDGDDAREFVLNFYAALARSPAWLPGRSSAARTDGCTSTRSAAGDRARRPAWAHLPHGTRVGQPTAYPRGVARQGPLRRGFCPRHAADQQRGPPGDVLPRVNRAFLADVGVLQRRRGHGNEPMPVTKADAKKPSPDRHHYACNAARFDQ